MNPNQIEIKRVFVREHDQLAMDNTLPRAPAIGEENQIVVEWEAGATANGDGAADIKFTVAIYDHTAGAPVGPALTAGPVAPSGDNASQTYEQILKLPVLTAGSMYEATTCLIRGANIASFYQGPMFVAY